MSTPKDSPPTSDVSRVSSERFFFLALLVVAGAAAFYFFFQSRSATSDIQAQNAELKRQNANIQTKLDELQAHELLLKQEKQLKQSRLEVAAGEAKTISATIDTLAEQVAAWRNTNDELLASDKGRRVAANQQSFLQYYALSTQIRPSEELPAQLRAQLKPLTDLIDDARKANNPLFSTSETLHKDLVGLAETAQKALTVYRDHNQQLAAILDQLPPAAPMGTPTLADAVTQFRTQEAADRATKLAQEIEKVRRENAEKDALEKAENERKVAEAKREADRRIAEAKARDIDQAATKDIASIEADIQRKKDAAEAERQRKLREEREAALEREMERDMPEIRSLLRPFLVEGTTQPARGTRLERTTTRGPISYAKLQGAGVLARTIDAQKKLYFLMGVSGHDRELGGFPSYFGGNDDWNRKHDTVQRAQDLLNKYGELMVKKNMLAP